MSQHPDYYSLSLRQVHLTALAVQIQISKDFEKMGMSFPQEFKEVELTFEKIVDLTQDQVVQVLEKGESELLKLLYLIDIPEKEFLLILPQDKFIELISEKIVLREAYKIYLRNKFGV